MHPKAAMEDAAASGNASRSCMARLARVVIPAIPHHITQRGNRRQPTFFCTYVVA
jgi:hypothetical protein